MRLSAGIHIWACESPMITSFFEDFLSPKTQVLVTKHPFFVWG